MNKYNFIRNNDDFLKTRLTSIGASDVATIIGVNKYCTPQSLWRIKTGRQSSPEINESMKWGIRLELPILSNYVESVSDKNTAHLFEFDYMNSKISRGSGDNFYKPITSYFPFTEFRFRHAKHFVVHPDLIDMEHKNLVEAKSNSHFMLNGNNINSYNQEENIIPLYYYLQCQAQMICTGLKQVILTALIDNRELRFTVNFNEKLQDKILEAINKFWWHITKDKIVMPSSFKDVQNMFPEIKEKETYLLGEQSEMATKMFDRKKFLKNKISNYKSEIEDINNGLGLFIAGNKYLYNENNEKLASQIQFTKEQLASIKEIKEKELDLYLRLKELDLIKNNEVRFIR